ncbi:MAG: hypothetical protein II222_06145 [Paraprevotella sp.]|nr:hypothetical protein [Paraprevotella sp.]
MIQCINCKHGRYMQWMKNPIICECQVQKERFVAESRRQCPLFEQRYTGEAEIVHYDHY